MAKSAQTFDHTEKRNAQIKRRYEHHQSFRNLAEEFPLGKSQLQRIVSD